MNKLPRSKKLYSDALVFAEEILSDIELTRTPLTNVSLKLSRLFRLLNDSYKQNMFQYEASGYPHSPGGYPPEIWAMLKDANRIETSEDKNGKVNQHGYWSSIEQLESQIETIKTRIAVSMDPDISISSANPGQFLTAPIGNKFERDSLQNAMQKSIERLSQRRAFLHVTISDIYTELKYSSLSDDIFSQIRETVDIKISDKVSSSLQKFTSAYDNLKSDNPEDWANAVHSCRRILQDLADHLYPPREDKIIGNKGSNIKIKLGKDNYINRLIAFIEDNSESTRFKELVGSNISYIGNRLDAIFRAAQKGSHSDIVNKEEASRYIIYTYLILGDILSL